MWGQDPQERGWHCIDEGTSSPANMGFDLVMLVSSHPSPNCSPAAWSMGSLSLAFPRGGLMGGGYGRYRWGRFAVQCLHCPHCALQLTLSPLHSYRLRPGQSLQSGLW